MTITVHLPDDLAQHPHPAEEAVAAVVLEAYRTKKLSQAQAAKILGLSRIETEDFLAHHVDLYDRSAADLEAEAEFLQRLQL